MIKIYSHISYPHTHIILTWSSCFLCRASRKGLVSCQGAITSRENKPKSSGIQIYYAFKVKTYSMLKKTQIRGPAASSRLISSSRIQKLASNLPATTFALTKIELNLAPCFNNLIVKTFFRHAMIRQPYCISTLFSS